DLESRAYTALEYAKRAGRNQVAVFDSSMVGASPERLALEQRLRQALPNGELLMNYQPQIELATGAATGVEALLRWKHPELGFVSPGTFIPIAEENGLICSFGEFALYESLRQAIAWRRQGMRSVRVCVNVSPLQFCRPDFAGRTIAAIQEFEIDPSQLELEITEGVIMQNVDAALVHMNRLREIGVQFAIDDFGTGHSSLAYLQKLPIQRIKIDRSFIKDITKASERPALVVNIIRLAHALGVPAIVEGIETLEQAIALTAMGCEEAQGYLFSKPLLGQELFHWTQHIDREPAGAVR
ncbi:MAG: putative bifunctional diguanylate cyclase/phosphodiesterase, partial [Bryobacteraceae bacterium]